MIQYSTLSFSPAWDQNITYSITYPTYRPSRNNNRESVITRFGFGTFVPILTVPTLFLTRGILASAERLIAFGQIGANGAVNNVGNALRYPLVMVLRIGNSNVNQLPPAAAAIQEPGVAAHALNLTASLRQQLSSLKRMAQKVLENQEMSFSFNEAFSNGIIIALTTTALTIFLRKFTVSVLPKTTDLIIPKSDETVQITQGFIILKQRLLTTMSSHIVLMAVYQPELTAYFYCMGIVSTVAFSIIGATFVFLQAKKKINRLLLTS
uniref:Uncharacterized protein n=1 Tax=Blidingia minima TaxID=63414 RepID=A0A8E5N766_9CHLO|nr:hypothetical protein [Blidingia minima]